MRSCFSQARIEARRSAWSNVFLGGGVIATPMLQQGAPPFVRLQRQMGREDFETLIMHYWKHINSQHLSSDVVARLEALGRTKAAHCLPNYCPTRVLHRKVRLKFNLEANLTN